MLSLENECLFGRNCGKLANIRLNESDLDSSRTLLIEQLSHVTHNSWANIGKLRNDCYPTVGNVRFANCAPTNHLSAIATGWLLLTW